MPTPFCSKEKGSHLYLFSHQKGLTDQRFAFTSIEQLLAVFGCPVGRKAMQEAGGRLSVYKVKPAGVIIGHHQCAFVTTMAKLEKVLDLVTLQEIPCESKEIMQ